jgi:hypothetical protein
MRILVAFAAAVSLAALLVALHGLRVAGQAAPSGADPRVAGLLQTGHARLAAVEEELAGLRRQVAAAESRLEALAAPGASDTPGATSVVDGKLERLAGEIEERLARLEAERRAAAPVIPSSTETPEERQALVEKNQAAAADRSLPPGTRVQALRGLRFREGRSRDVTLAMLELVQDPGLEPAVRADIIRNLDGVDFPELQHVLLEVLRSDADPETRAEAVESLQIFYGDPAVREVVTGVRDRDPDPRVRAEAVKRLLHYEMEAARREAPR